jgi:hypothetical protein
MLHQIVLQMAISICVSDFLTHVKKGSKYGRHLVINSLKRTHTIQCQVLDAPAHF